MQSRKKINFSIFLKLILLIIVFIILVNASIGFIIRMSFEGGPFKPPNKLSYMFNDYFLKDIGDPPDTIKARAVLREMGLNIRFETSASGWSSNPDVPTISELKGQSDFEERKDREKFTVRKNNRFYEIVNTGKGFVIFAPPMPRDDLNLEKSIIPLIIMITLLASLLYFSLRWIFGPIKKLSYTVEQISEGNFETSLEINRKDELGNLGDSINKMKNNISNMLKSKESLLIDVSHELRSPLTRIKLANEFVDDDKIKHKINDDVKEMETMISGLLDTYRLENINGGSIAEKADIVKLINEVSSKFQSAEIKIISERDRMDVRIEKEKIETALKNIIDNAVKYSDGKPIEIRISGNPADRNETIISIKDSGRGIEKEELDKIFEPFYRVDKSRDKKISGYGLGLSIVKKILDSHKSSIDITSTPGIGTEFRIKLRNK